jgi:hypothetical protein
MMHLISCRAAGCELFVGPQPNRNDLRNKAFDAGWQSYGLDDFWLCPSHQNDEATSLRIENERLRAANDRLRGALRKVAPGNDLQLLTPRSAPTTCSSRALPRPVCPAHRTITTG